MILYLQHMYCHTLQGVRSGHLQPAADLQECLHYAWVEDCSSTHIALHPGSCDVPYLKAMAVHCNDHCCFDKAANAGAYGA